MFGLNSFFHKAKNTIIGQRIGYIMILIIMFVVSFIISYFIVSNSRSALQSKELLDERDKTIAKYNGIISSKDAEISALNETIADLNAKIEELTISENN